jgi:hypothetical protein
VLAVLLVVALVVFQAEGAPVQHVGEAEFNREMAPFLGGDGKLYLSLHNIRQRLDVSKEGRSRSLDRVRKQKDNYLQFGDLGETVKPDPNRAGDPDKELEDLEYQLRNTFLVQRNSVKRMVKLKRRMDALIKAAQRQSGMVDLGESDDEKFGHLSLHEINHVLSWKPESPAAHTDTYPSFKDLESPKEKEDAPPDKQPPDVELGQGLDSGDEEEMQKFLGRGLKAGALDIKRGLYEEVESAKDLDGNVNELASMVATITKHVSSTQKRHIDDLGPSYFLKSKVRKAHHQSHAAKVGRAQLRKLAEVDKFNQFMHSEGTFAEGRLKAMIASLRICSKSMGSAQETETLPTDAIENLTQVGRHLNGILKRQGHVARQTLRKCNSIQAYVKKLREELDQHKLTPKEMGILP